MKRLVTLIFLVGLLVPTLSGCFHNRIIVEKNYNASATTPDYSKGWQPYLLAGLVPLGDNPIDMRAICPQGAGIVEVKKTFLNGLVGGLTLGILGFQEINIYCAKAAAENASDGTGEFASN